MSTNIVEKFSKNLINIEYPQKNEGWNIKGTLKKNSNQDFKFDVRNMQKREDHLLQKQIFSKSKAEKIVFETDKQWAILDAEELIKFIITTKKRIVHLNDLLNELNWNIYVNKSL